MTDFPEPDFISVNGIKMAVYRSGPDPKTTDKPALLLMHGFPELAYSWRSVMPKLADAGYPVIAPDMRGYGRTEAPKILEHYSMAHLTGDMAALADALGLDRVVAVGHDWGALVLWMLPFYCPGRFEGFAGLNVAHMPRLPLDPIELFRQRLGDAMYIVRFQEVGTEAILEKDVAQTVRYFMRKPANRTKPTERIQGKPTKSQGLDFLGMLEAGPEKWGGQALLSEAEEAHYIEAFTRTGYKPALDWYRNMSANWRDSERFLVDGALPVIKEPVYMITADMDQACPAWMADGMLSLCADLSRLDLKACGHWSAQERPDEVCDGLLSWLEEKF